MTIRRRRPWQSTPETGTVLMRRVTDIRLLWDMSRSRALGRPFVLSHLVTSRCNARCAACLVALRRERRRTRRTGGSHHWRDRLALPPGGQSGNLPVGLMGRRAVAAGRYRGDPECGALCRPFGHPHDEWLATSRALADLARRRARSWSVSTTWARTTTACAACPAFLRDSTPSLLA